MGFTTGFTGGVTLTLSIAYLTVLAHQRNRERQSGILRANNYVVSGLTDPLPPVVPPTRSEIAAVQRAHFVETAKDKWNAEIEGAVRKVQETDWVEVREGVETALGRLWSGSAAATATATTGESVKSAAEEAKSAGAAAVSKGEQKAEEAKGSVLSAVSKGIQKGKEAIGLAKDKVASAEQRVEKKLSPVEQALQQRYEKQSAPSQSVEEALAERYVPVDQRNNGVLRGL
ncbi:hypothetical protein BX600DRAFT_434516 [Xylariales sp. PMI_506]|nr:hypothetical protein BX600DRAFT_434516 [Xylariales sp. PMI_506]